MKKISEQNYMIYNKLKEKESMFSARQMENEFRTHEKYKKQLSRKHFNGMRINKIKLAPIPQYKHHEETNIGNKVGFSKSPELYKSLSDRDMLSDNDFNYSEVTGTEKTYEISLKRSEDVVSP